MGGKSKKKKAQRAAQAAAAQEAATQEAERVRIQTETETMQRNMGEELAAKRRARQLRGTILLGSQRAGMGKQQTETLG